MHRFFNHSVKTGITSPQRYAINQRPFASSGIKEERETQR